MTAAPPEVAARINDAVFRAGLTMPAVLERAKVTRTTWWRIKKGKPFHGSTIDRIDKAIADLTAESVGAPDPGDQAGKENDDGATRGDQADPPERSPT